MEDGRNGVSFKLGDVGCGEVDGRRRRVDCRAGWLHFGGDSRGKGLRNGRSRFGTRRRIGRQTSVFSGWDRFGSIAGGSPAGPTRNRVLRCAAPSGPRWLTRKRDVRTMRVDIVWTVFGLAAMIPGLVGAQGGIGGPPVFISKLCELFHEVRAEQSSHG